MGDIFLFSKKFFVLIELVFAVCRKTQKST